MGSLAKWVQGLPEEAQCVAAFQLANEPALGRDAAEMRREMRREMCMCMCMGVTCL